MNAHEGILFVVNTGKHPATYTYASQDYTIPPYSKEDPYAHMPEEHSRVALRQVGPPSPTHKPGGPVRVLVRNPGETWEQAASRTMKEAGRQAIERAKALAEEAREAMAAAEAAERDAQAIEATTAEGAGAAA